VRASLLAEDVGILYHCGLIPADSLLYSIAEICDSSAFEHLGVAAIILMLDRAKIVSSGWPTSLVEPLKEVRGIVCTMEQRVFRRPENAVKDTRPLFKELCRMLDAIIDASTQPTNPLRS